MPISDTKCRATCEVVPETFRRCIRPHEHLEQSHVWIEDITTSKGAPIVIIWNQREKIEARLIIPEIVQEVDRTARAYGWEVGRGHPLVKMIEELSDDNPFMDPDWTEKMVG